MGYLTARTTQELQTKIVDQADEDTLILTPGRRLARRLRHAFRIAQIERGRRAWLPPKIATLNSWLNETWLESWPEECIISDIACLCLWKEAVEETVLPEGLESDIGLYRLLDETYSAIIRHKIPPLPRDYPSPLIGWRQKVMEVFEGRLRAKGYAHPAFLPALIKDKLRNGSCALPKQILCVGFASPAPVENDLLAGLAGDHGAVICSTESPVCRTNGTGRNEPPRLKAVSLPDVEQEIMWLAQDVLEKAQDTPLHRIGVVVPNMRAYAPLLSRVFQELAGSPTVEKGEIFMPQEDTKNNEDNPPLPPFTKGGALSGGNYNISLGESLFSQPLIQAALLPLRLLLEGERRGLFLALLLSPYYGLWSRRRNILAQADRVWREYSVDQGLGDMLYILQKEKPEILSFIHHPGHDLARLIQGLTRKRTGAGWVETLYRLWDITQFPAIGNERENGIFRHLGETLSTLVNNLGEEELEASTFYAWLKYALEETKVNVPGYEEAGIQVIGLIESRGLSFDHLYVVGLSAGSLPQPVRHFPLLTREEKALVQGATIESQYLFAEQAFAHLMTAAPAITLTRPLEEKSDPLPASPFWPEDEENTAVNYWLEPGQASLRAGWLRQAHEGWRDYPVPYPPEDTPLVPAPLPDELSATAIEKAISCPFKFFADTVLRLSELPEPTIGISAQEKGNRLHRLLALFTNRMRKQGVSLTDAGQSESILKGCVADVLADVTDNPYWQIERERWSGLLATWLCLERKRKEEGWRWLLEEANFSSLRNALWPFTVHGRIDRIDINDGERRICCWDYKTGNTPPPADIHTHFLAPQIPLYLLALRSGKISLPVSPENPPVSPFSKGGIDGIPSFPKGEFDKSPFFFKRGLNIPPLLSKGGWGGFSSSFVSSCDTCVSLQYLAAGYIGLKSEGEVQFGEPVKDEAGWETCLSAWEKEITSLGQRLSAGNFPADPKPIPEGRRNGACQYCPYLTLCTYWKKEEENGGVNGCHV
ncbi:MAG: PD-(D/E)XK nuclease family protein [Thermodesulfobacteriota bacterium]